MCKIKIKRKNLHLQMRFDATFNSYLVQWAGSNDEYSLFLTRELIAKLYTKLFELKQLNNAMATVTLNVINIVKICGDLCARQTEEVDWRTSLFKNCNLSCVSSFFGLTLVSLIDIFLLLYLLIFALLKHLSRWNFKKNSAAEYVKRILKSFVSCYQGRPQYFR